MIYIIEYHNHHQDWLFSVYLCNAKLILFRMDSYLCIFLCECLFNFLTRWYCWLMTQILFWRISIKTEISFPMFMKSTLPEDICEMWTLLYGPSVSKLCVIMFTIPMPKSFLNIHMIVALFFNLSIRTLNWILVTVSLRSWYFAA